MKVNLRPQAGRGKNLKEICPKCGQEYLIYLYRRKRINNKLELIKKALYCEACQYIKLYKPEQNDTKRRSQQTTKTPEKKAFRAAARADKLVQKGKLRKLLKDNGFYKNYINSINSTFKNYKLSKK